MWDGTKNLYSGFPEIQIREDTDQHVFNMIGAIKFFYIVNLGFKESLIIQGLLGGHWCAAWSEPLYKTPFWHWSPYHTIINKQHLAYKNTWLRNMQEHLCFYCIFSDMNNFMINCDKLWNLYHFPQEKKEVCYLTENSKEDQ